MLVSSTLKIAGDGKEEVDFGLVHSEVQVKSQVMAVFSQTDGSKKGLFSILV